MADTLDDKQRIAIFHPNLCHIARYVAGKWMCMCEKTVISCRTTNGT